jgi:hypothetical protein
VKKGHRWRVYKYFLKKEKRIADRWSQVIWLLVLSWKEVNDPERSVGPGITRTLSNFLDTPAFFRSRQALRWFQNLPSSSSLTYHNLPYRHSHDKRHLAEVNVFSLLCTLFLTFASDRPINTTAPKVSATTFVVVATFAASITNHGSRRRAARAGWVQMDQISMTMALGHSKSRLAKPSSFLCDQTSFEASHPKTPTAFSVIPSLLAVG